MNKLDIDKFSNFVAEIQPMEKIAFITSGGSLIERDLINCVEIHNYSSGRRACEFAEEFLKNNYYVIFLYRENSAIPYIHHIDIKTLFTKTLVEINDLIFFDNYKETIINYKRLYEKHLSKLFVIPYTSVKDYLLKKEFVLKEIVPLQEKVVVLLSAVNNYDIPNEHQKAYMKSLTEESEHITINLNQIDNQM
jgi:hypothetical protein